MTQEELLEQWEPKVHSMLRNISIAGMEKEDLEQEMRICILKASKKWDPTYGVLFHTYLHATMLNTLKSLMWKAVIPAKSYTLDLVKHESIARLEISMYSGVKLCGGEALLLDLLLCGYKFSEIKRLSQHPRVLIKVKEKLRDKFMWLKEMC